MKRILPRFVCLFLLATCLFHAASHVRLLKLQSTAAPLRPADEFEANRGQSSLNFVARTRPAERIAIDAEGNTYLAMTINRTQFPSVAGEKDILVTKFNAAGSRMLYSTVIGGDDEDSLGGFSVDAAGSVYLACNSSSPDFPGAVLFSGFGQINFQIPPGTASGNAQVKVTSNGAAIAAGAAPIARVAPGVFTANANGRGVAAAVALRVKPDNSQVHETIARYDPSLKQFVSIPIDLGPEGDQIILSLFGTGWRFRSSESAVRVAIGGPSGSVDAPVTYAGLQPTLTGLDQINVRLPRTLIGRGEVDVVVTVDGKTANAVRVNLK